MYSKNDELEIDLKSSDLVTNFTSYKTKWKNVKHYKVSKIYNVNQKPDMKIKFIEEFNCKENKTGKINVLEAKREYCRWRLKIWSWIKDKTGVRSSIWRHLLYMSNIFGSNWCPNYISKTLA